MSDPTVFRASLAYANVFDAKSPPVALSARIPYTGKRLFCSAVPQETTLAFTISDRITSVMNCPIDGRPEVLPAMPGGPYDRATLAVSYEGAGAELPEPVPIAYSGGPIIFHLRFDGHFATAAAYLSEAVPGGPLFAALMDELERRPRDDRAEPRLLGVEFFRRERADSLGDQAPGAVSRSHQLFFVAVNDGEVAEMPYKAIFVHNQVVIPAGATTPTALIPPEDGGSEHGPMGLLIE
ncbi:MAG TPA: hypothetical protein VGC96_05550 [Candidatus Elarobacter sp.]|jgi:hypothetical protein